MSTSGVIDSSQYRRIVVLTGAGVSAGSGLPTYRGAGGLWNADNVRRYATAAAVSEDPRGVWGFFARMRSLIAAATPSAAHLALARLGQALTSGQTLTVLTQNVDGNFVRAARFEGARTVYVNLEPMAPANPAFQETVVGPADEVLPKLLNVAL